MSDDDKENAEGLHSATRDAAAGSEEVRAQVRALTVAALEKGRLDAERIRRVIEEAIEGASEGARARGRDAENAFEEALRGIDEALAKAAHASQLAIEEARARMSEYSEEELADARRELEDLERRFLDVLDQVARRSDTVARAVMEDVARHLRDTGTAVGGQVAASAEEIGEELRRGGEAQLRAGVDSAMAAGAQIAQVASGFLTGLADSLEAARKKDRDDDG